MKDKNNNQDCNGLENCRGCIECDNSSWCDNSTACDNCVNLMYCCDLTLEKFKIFNKSFKTKEAYQKVKNKIITQLGYSKHPKDLTKSEISWLRKNIKQFDSKVLNKIIKDSIKKEEK